MFVTKGQNLDTLPRWNFPIGYVSTSVFIVGRRGSGKTTVLKKFLKEQKPKGVLYHGVEGEYKQEDYPNILIVHCEDFDIPLANKNELGKHLSEGSYIISDDAGVKKHKSSNMRHIFDQVCTIEAFQYTTNTYADYIVITDMSEEHFVELTERHHLPGAKAAFKKMQELHENGMYLVIDTSRKLYMVYW